METTAIQTLKRLKSLYTLSRSAANIYDLHELNLARIGKELLEKREEQRLQNDIANQVTSRFVYTAQCTIVQSAVGYCNCMSSVCDVGGSGPHRLEILETNCSARTLSPTPSLFGAQRPSTYTQGNMGKFGGD